MVFVNPSPIPWDPMGPPRGAHGGPRGPLGGPTGGPRRPLGGPSAAPRRPHGGPTGAPLRPHGGPTGGPSAAPSAAPRRVTTGFFREQRLAVEGSSGAVDRGSSRSIASSSPRAPAHEGCDGCLECLHGRERPYCAPWPESDLNSFGLFG